MSSAHAAGLGTLAALDEALGGLAPLTDRLDVASLARLQQASKALHACVEKASFWKRAFLALRRQFPSVVDEDPADGSDSYSRSWGTRRWGVPSPDGDGSRIALDPRLALCDDEARGAWLLLHPQPSWQAVFALTYRGLVTAASRLRAVPRVQPGSYYLCDTRDDEEDIWQVARFRSFADFDRQVISTPKWLQLVRYAQLAWAEMGWRGCNNNVTDEIIARGWEDTAGLSNTSAREGVFSYITMEEMHLKDGALVHFYITWAKEQRPRQAGEVVVVPDAPRPPFFDTPGCAAHIEALCSPVPYDELPAGLFDEATLARLRLRRGVGEFCRRTRRGWRAVCEDEESGLDSGDLSEDSGSDSSEVTS